MGNLISRIFGRKEKDTLPEYETTAPIISKDSTPWHIDVQIEQNTPKVAPNYYSPTTHSNTPNSRNSYAPYTAQATPQPNPGFPKPALSTSLGSFPVSPASQTPSPPKPTYAVAARASLPTPYSSYTAHPYTAHPYTPYPPQIPIASLPKEEPSKSIPKPPAPPKHIIEDKRTNVVHAIKPANSLTIPKQVANRPPLPSPPSSSTIYLYPRDIRFTQGSVSHRFTNGFPVEATIHTMRKYPAKLKEFPAIRVMHINSAYWSLDNRRLFVIVMCAPDTPLLCILEPNTAQNMEEFRVKKTNADGGVPRFGHY